MTLEKLLLILTIILGIYEVLSRAIPTIKDNSIISFIIRILKAISDGLNRRNPIAKQYIRDCEKEVKQKLNDLSNSGLPVYKKE